ncbi:non-canonical purine NTP pyrophosphatase, RdgB/HAM1 family [Aphanothece hegewaldii CCALA 016]|uniref:dITP/XTP pyrophosphatase n=1 Tax=Aphanothece hegewaldii CCALA 016 TaxID=2107694 RepID=A0A2T1M0W5_9CHRO|nr:RdgB/HAM1 family non-canonical purine NTP pyrophosphatase [Aphanothece hegewaldii]PSF38338.1 non-canonical purine NTP pyrophosphatase, RdgB/HAM1 family [Aphanothece hegewaldii CCALA 016]
MKLIVATSNPGKIKELQDYLNEDKWELALMPKDIEIEETGQTFTENACIKASGVAQRLGEWTIADDSGLSVDALDGAPGLYSARYGNTDQDRITRLLRELGDHSHRQAQFICAIAIARPDGTIYITTEGICQGKILYQPMGTGGFGYDPIFYVPQLDQTFAQMLPEVKRKISHRGQAFKKLLPELAKILNI